MSDEVIYFFQVCFDGSVSTDCPAGEECIQYYENHHLCQKSCNADKTCPGDLTCYENVDTPFCYKDCTNDPRVCGEWWCDTYAGPGICIPRSSEIPLVSAALWSCLIIKSIYTKVLAHCQLTCYLWRNCTVRISPIKF